MKLKIISGGQIGADRAGLDVALKWHIPHGGWCPKGRKAIDGKIPTRYNLDEMATPSYLARTKQNVLDSDGTVVFYFDKAKGGTKRTIDFCVELKKNYLEINLSEPFLTNCLLFKTWFDVQLRNCKGNLYILNVAGSRESEFNNIYNLVTEILEYCLKKYCNL